MSPPPRPTRTSRPFFSWSTFTWPLSLCQSLLTTRVLRRPPNFAFCFQSPTSFHCWRGVNQKLLLCPSLSLNVDNFFSGNLYNLVKQRGVSWCIVYHFCHTHSSSVFKDTSREWMNIEHHVNWIASDNLQFSKLSFYHQQKWQNLYHFCHTHSSSVFKDTSREWMNIEHHVNWIASDNLQFSKLSFYHQQKWQNLYHFCHTHSSSVFKDASREWMNTTSTELQVTTSSLWLSIWLVDVQVKGKGE